MPQRSTVSRSTRPICSPVSTLIATPSRPGFVISHWSVVGHPAASVPVTTQPGSIIPETTGPPNRRLIHNPHTGPESEATPKTKRRAPDGNRPEPSSSSTAERLFRPPRALSGSLPPDTLDLFNPQPILPTGIRILIAFALGVFEAEIDMIEFKHHLFTV